MEVIETGFKDLVILKPQIFSDARGYFFESYNLRSLQTTNLNYHFVQDNQSGSAHGVIRGLHYQKRPFAQTKLVRAIVGEIFDVAVDLRAGALTYGRWYGIKLSDENKLQLLIPKGFAHGFAVLSSFAVVLYKTDDFYRKEAERGIIYNDPDLNIDWQIPLSRAVVSDRDRQLPPFRLLDTDFHI
jgi:dTDP-4-dehydrorhamnose 3,5-epimerase